MGSFYLFLACSAILVIVSLASPHQPTEQSSQLTWTRPLDGLREPGWTGWRNYKFLSLVLIACVVSVYVVLG